MKKILILLLTLALLLTGASALTFSDVTEKTAEHNAITALSDRGILTGFPDGTFRPKDGITRAEAAAVVVRLMGYATDETPSAFSDVADAFWGRPYIMAAAREGIIDGMGGGKFAPSEKVTYYQIVKMLVCAAGQEKLALEKGGWPTGYADAAEEVGILNNLERYIVGQGKNSAAPRAAVASYSYNLLQKMAFTVVTVGGRTYRLGQSAEGLPAADEVVPSCQDWMWHIYGTDTYRNFYILGIRSGKIAAVGAEGGDFVFDGQRCGDVAKPTQELTPLLSDKHNGGKIHGVLLLEDNMQLFFSKNNSPEALRGEARVNFHCTNAFRVMHGKNILLWDERAAEAARLHSQDMADRNYFRHDSLDGRKFSVRLQQQGIVWRGCAENIYAGQFLGLAMHDGWVNSLGHRTNILRDNTYMGVGGGYHQNSENKTYFTQDFWH